MEQLGEGGLCNLWNLIDKSLLTELITEDRRTDRLRRVIERIDRHSFELMGPYTNPLWHQLSVVVDDCILVGKRLAVSGQLQTAVLKQIHPGHPWKEAMLDFSNYLCWPLKHKYKVLLAEECRSCTRLGRMLKTSFLKVLKKSLRLLTQPSQKQSARIRKITWRPQFPSVILNFHQ